MRLKAFALIIIITTSFSCRNSIKESNTTGTEQEVNNETPQALDEHSDFKSISISKRYTSDIISELYDEAIDKSTKLKELNDEINKISEFKNESISEYSKFIQTNNNYWLTANRYINQIQDSLLKESTIEIFKDLELKFKSKMRSHKQKIMSINKKTLVLNDQLILMKLFITEPMMKNYQVNEKPNIKSLENIIYKYDELIKETKEYTKTIK